MPYGTIAVRITILVVLALMPTTSWAQTDTGAGRGTDALLQLVRYVAANGRAASTGEYVTTYEYSLSASSRCDAILRESPVMANKEELLEYTLRLGLLSPEIEIKPWRNESLVSVRSWTTTGNADVAVKVRRARYGNPPSQVRAVGLVMTDRPTADTVAALLRDAILTCGGQPQDSLVAAKQGARSAELRTRLDSLTGVGLTSEQRAGVLAACEAAVRGALTAPGSAVFGSEPKVLSDKPNHWMVMGQVEAENSYGGRVQNKYTCLVQAFGKQFVSDPPILY